MHPNDHRPFVSAEKNLSEITLRVILLAIVLTIILAAANAYLSLRVGMTVSASIPAAVVSMGVLRMFRNSNILENNIVQTAASAGEAVVGPIAYTIPALLVMKFWVDFNYFSIFCIVLLGGWLGVLFSVPLRRILLEEKTLRFPEGVAIGNVLKANSESKTGLKYLIRGGIISGLIGFAQTGLHLLSDSMQIWREKGAVIYGSGLGFSPALIAAGYIVGINVCIALFIGICIGSLVGIPVLSSLYPMPAGQSVSAYVVHLYLTKSRYIGVGTMLAGGIWTMVRLAKPVMSGIQKSFAALKQQRLNPSEPIIRTERDFPIHYVVAAIIAIMVPLGFFYMHSFAQTLNISSGLLIVLMGCLIVFTIVVGFMVASLCGYFAGLVGSTNSPISGVGLCAIILGSFLILFILGFQVHFSTEPLKTLTAEAIAIVVCAVIVAGGGICVDTIQDLKAGQMVGATPWKQQLMLMIGVLVAACVIPLVLELLFKAYGIAGVFPRPGMDPSHMLSAPQAELMAAVSQGVFGSNLPWPVLFVGIGFGVICILIDEALMRFHLRLPVLAVGIGIYLPLGASTPLIFGGVVSYLVNRKFYRWRNRGGKEGAERVHRNYQASILLACGLVAGASLMGVILAIPFALFQSPDILQIMPNSMTSVANLLGLLSAIGLCIWMYRVANRR